MGEVYDLLRKHKLKPSKQEKPGMKPG